MSATFRNPVLPGFYPDPSICRVGSDYYLVTSTFEYFPGLPVFHSQDLVHWRQIGHVLDRPSQLALDGIQSSGGLYAPTIRHHKGVFYVVNTLVDKREEPRKPRNFIVSAANPGGPWADWSEPKWLEGACGYDPSLFFDDDGRAWYCENRVAFEGHYEGHTEIWLQELDLNRLELTGEACCIWDGALKGAIWSEAAHIYKKDGTYYLLTAEGGTAHHHAVAVARSKTICGPYAGNPANPILTHRHLGLDYPIVGTGHGDLVETQHGEWWMVLLAMRPRGGYFYNLGRETFLVPVRWEEGWPVACPGSGKVEDMCTAPALPEKAWPTPANRDDFELPGLAHEWVFLRTPREDFFSLSERPGYLRLKLRPQRLSEECNPSFVGRRQQHHHFSAETVLEFSPQGGNETAGLALIQNPDFYYLMSVSLKKGLVIQLIKRAYGKEEVLNELPAAGMPLRLKVEGRDQDYAFYFSTRPGQWTLLAGHADGRILSTPTAGGFVGTVIGLYASSNGEASSNRADFDWFEYRNLSE